MLKAEIVALIVGGLAAFAALLNAAVALYNAWRDNRRLVVRLEPVDARHAPASDKPGTYRVIFVARLSVFNPARTRNTLVRARAWRDDQQVTCRWLPSGPPFAPMVIEPFEDISGEVVVDAFETAPDVREAYQSVSRIRIEVQPARGRRKRFCFELAKFPQRTQ